MLKQTLPKINSYEIVNGKYIKVDSSSENQYINGLDTLKASILRENPFNYNSSKSVVQVYSIEDFLISVNKVEMSLGDVIRNPDFPNGRRKRIIKKAFKSWNKEYLKKKNFAFKESEKNIAVIEDMSYPKLKFRTLIILAFLLAFLLFIGGSSRLWDSFALSSVGNYFKLTIDSMYNDFPWLRIIGNVAIYLTILLIFYSTFFSNFSRKFTKDYKMAQTFLNSSETTISKDYKKKYKKARRYYLKAINNSKKPYFPPLEIKEIEEGMVSIAVFKEVSQKTVDRAYRFKKIKPIIIGIKNILFGLSLIGGAGMLGMLLYKVVISFF
jgi:hypothetical protein